MKPLNRYTELYLDCTMGHGLDDECGCGEDPKKIKKKVNGVDTCVDCSYTSDFGTGATNQLQTTVYMAARVAVFTYDNLASFPSVLTFGIRGRSFFKDCENFRRDGQTGNNHACGSGASTYTLCNGTAVCTETGLSE